jgi:hypothetical protein
MPWGSVGRGRHRGAACWARARVVPEPRVTRGAARSFLRLLPIRPKEKPMWNTRTPCTVPHRRASSGLDHGVGHPVLPVLVYSSWWPPKERWCYLEECRDRGKHRAGLLPEKALPRCGPVRTRQGQCCFSFCRHSVVKAFMLTKGVALLNLAVGAALRDNLHRPC